MRKKRFKNDSGRIRKLTKIFDEITKSHAVIGVIGGAHKDEDGNVFDMPRLAAEHELGNEKTGNPERSFLRSSLIENKGMYKQQLADLLRQVTRGEITVDDAYNKIGAIASGQAKQKILDGEFTPLKKETIRRKGSSKPLIDTGQLLQSITWDKRHD